MKHLVLFDIDGTILNFNNEVAKESFIEIIEDYFGCKVPEVAVPKFHGMTDLKILQEITNNLGLSFASIEPKIDEIWSKTHQIFQTHSKEENVTLLPGIMDLIDTLSSDDNIKLGLLTGNFYENAYLKLSINGLSKYFPTGAFGSDNADRNLLPPIAINRINEYYNTDNFTNLNTIIIGDTYKDIECAKCNNIKVMAVATGHYTISELEEYEPDCVLENFSNLKQSLNEIYSLLNNIDETNNNRN